MEERRILNLNSVDDLWNELLPDFSSGTVVNNYHVTLKLNGHSINLDISSSPGGNAEGGYESTNINAPLPAHPNFSFVIFPEDFLNRLGKIFGMQDVVLGYPEFDNRIIVKTNNPEKLTSVFSEKEVRLVFQSLSGFSLKLDSNDETEEHFLELSIQRAIREFNELKQVLTAYTSVLSQVVEKNFF